MIKLLGILVVVGLWSGCGKDKPIGPQGQKIEVRTERYDNGEVKVEYQYYLDFSEGMIVRHGFYNEYDEEGHRTVEAVYDAGMRMSITFSFTGPQGQKIEPWTEYYRNGEIMADYQYYLDEAGRIVRHGYYNEFYDKYEYVTEIMMKVEGSYSEGEAVGTWKYVYYEAYSYSGDELGGITVRGTFKDGKKWNGSFVEDMGGSFLVEYLNNGLIRGKTKYGFEGISQSWSFWENGNLRQYTDYHHSTGGISEQKVYYQNGQLRSSIAYDAGFRMWLDHPSGVWVDYYENGNKQWERYFNRAPVLFVWYDEDGSPIEIHDFGNDITPDYEDPIRKIDWSV